RELHHDRGRRLRRFDLLAPVDHSRGDRAVRQHDDRSADRPAAQVGGVYGAQHHHGPEGFSSPTNAAFRSPAARKRFITAITSPYATALSARKIWRVSLSPFAAASSVLGKRSRLTGSSPSASVRSDFTVRYSGRSGRGCGSAVDAGRLTRMSTVASGAATMKIISSTNITSMNGVTLISCTSSSVSSP